MQQPLQMTVIVDGEQQLRHVHSVVKGHDGRWVQTPVLRDDEEMRSTVDGIVHIFKVPKSERFLSSVVADWNGGERQTYTAEYSDGSTETWNQETFYAWKASEREWKI